MPDPTRNAPAVNVYSVPPRGAADGDTSHDALRSAPTSPVVGIGRRTAHQTSAAPGAPAAAAAILKTLGYVPTSELTPLTAEAASLQSQVEAAQAQVAALTSQVASLNSQASAAGAGTASLTSELAGLNQQIAAAQQQLATNQARLASLNAAISAANARAQSLQQQAASLGAQYGSLLSTLSGDTGNVIPGLRSTLGALQTQLAALQSELAGITGPGGPLRAAQAKLASDTQAYNGVLGTLQGLQSEVQSYNTVSLPSLPALTSGPNDVDEDVPGGPNDPGYGPYDPPFTGFAPYLATFLVAAPSLAQGPAASAHAVRRFDAVSSSSLGPTGASGIVARLAAGWGYVPGSEITTEDQQIASLQSALATANSQAGQLGAQAASLEASIASAQSQQASLSSQIGAAQSALAALSAQVSASDASVASATSQLAGANGSVASLTAVVSSLQGSIAAIQGGPVSTSGTPLNLPSANAVIASLQASIAALQDPSNPSSIPAAQASVASANAQVASAASQDSGILAETASAQQEASTWQGYLTAIGQGNLPFSVAWDFGDSTVGTAQASTNHTYLSAGSFTPSVTLSVTRPDGVVVSRTFTLPGILVGLWPTSVNVGDHAGAGSVSVPVTVSDANGNPVTGSRVIGRLYIWASGVRVDRGLTVITAPGAFTVLNAQDTTDLGYGWQLTFRSLRNPTVTNQAGDGYQG